MAQSLKRLPLIKAAQIRFRPVAIVVGSCHAPMVFLRVLGIFTLHKNQHIQILIRLG